MNASKKKGTTWESAIVGYLRDSGALHAERRALAGNSDRGDIAGLPGVVLEAKSCARVEPGAWVDEANRERDNDGADVGIVWFKRRGRLDPASGYVLMDGETLVKLLRSAGYITSTQETS